RCRCIRCHEIKERGIDLSTLRFDDFTYKADFTEEHFLSFVTPDDKLAGFLRLSLPAKDAPQTAMDDLKEAAIIREVHVYGQSLPVGAASQGAAQHIGLGGKLMEQAEVIAREHGFLRMAVIAAVGTREYYIKRGFVRGDLYLTRAIEG
ncbi:MAG: tRNA uridine(34) 5-carboxymethylaminomethyl modification radical SAM/GNAT enzyme Elp3, partial [Chloroflexota bacterium]